jgi:hypothetical protein
MTAYATYRTTGVVGKTLPLAYQLLPKWYNSVTVARLILTDLAVGDLVHAYGAGQAELLSYPTLGPDRAMHCRFLKVTKTDNNSSLEGLVLDRPMGHNFTQAQHYSLLTAAGSFVVTAALAGTVQVMLVMYAAALSGIATDTRSLSVKYVELRADVLRSPPPPMVGGSGVTIAVNGDVVYEKP